MFTVGVCRRLRVMLMLMVLGAMQFATLFFGATGVHAQCALVRESFAHETLCVSREISSVSGHAAHIPVPRRRLERFVAERYRITGTSARRIVEAVCDASHVRRVDPLLVIAVIAVESSFDARAQGGEPVSLGLMQIVAAAHPEKLRHYGGINALLQVEANVHVGTWVLREYLQRDGSTVAALQRYNGARWDRQCVYSRKVLTIRHLLQAVAFGSDSVSVETATAQCGKMAVG